VKLRYLVLGVLAARALLFVVAGCGSQATLPASASHRNASETFRREASATNPNYAHLGLWNL
jgi:hypothetical protein